MGVPIFDKPIAAMAKAVDDVEHMIADGATWVENRLKGSNVNAGASKSTKFGEGSNKGPSGYDDLYDPRPEPVYSGPRLEGQLDLGRPGDPSNPLPRVPWDLQAIGVAPENPGFVPDLPRPVPYNRQRARLRYRKFALDSGL